MPTFPLSPAPSQVRINEDTSPTEVTPLAHCAPFFSEFTDSGPQVLREGQSVLFKLPFVGTVQCPDCTDTITGREWYSIKGSIIKHLRFKHHQFDNGTVDVSFVSTHIGHSCEVVTHKV
ncbi:hypothetical protein CDAR_602881 [Caerostris darwini]|uniref:Uncharacterized protein n=1 Tax=Caerostris darwini TaxID=1538125 RepID=A0AAV4WKI5_9ARAC|nr:hypothetical protein CDAR_602881 [Caerostris darwini]